jgi:hypothetical protein
MYLIKMIVCLCMYHEKKTKYLCEVVIIAVHGKRKTMHRDVGMYSEEEAGVWVSLKSDVLHADKEQKTVIIFIEVEQKDQITITTFKML